jgi:Flp pilus assembly protein TadB
VVVILAAVAAALLIVASAVAGARESEKGSSPADRLRAIEQKRTQALVNADTQPRASSWPTTREHTTAVPNKPDLFLESLKPTS